MTVSIIASGIYQVAKAASSGEWIWRAEWSKAMKMAWRQVMRKAEGIRESIEKKAGELNILKELELKGSPKQISWAESIINTFLAHAGQEINSAIIRAEEGSMPERWAYNVLDSALEVANYISINAGEIINNRVRLTGSMISQIAQAKYNA